MGNTASSLPGNLHFWRETWTFWGKFTCKDSGKFKGPCQEIYIFSDLEQTYRPTVSCKIYYCVLRFVVKEWSLTCHMMYFVQHKFTIFGITTFITKMAKPTLACSLVLTNHNHHHHHHHHPNAKPSSYQSWMACIAIVCGSTMVSVCRVMYMLICKPIKHIGLKA